MLTDSFLAASNNLKTVQSDLSRTNYARNQQMKRALREKLTLKKTKLNCSSMLMLKCLNTALIMLKLTPTKMSQSHVQKQYLLMNLRPLPAH